MSDWQVLGRGSDPTPGDPTRVRELASALNRQAELTEGSTDRLRSVSANDADLRLEGDYAPKFRQVLGELPQELSKWGPAYRGCSQALSTYAGTLEQAKTAAGRALRDGVDAHWRYEGAVSELSALVPGGELAVRSVLGWNPYAMEAASLGLDEGTKEQVRAAVRRARLAEADREAAQRLADQAAALRGDAEARCVDGIKAALDGSGLKNKALYKKAFDFATTPFRSWHDFVNLCKNVAMVAGIAALLISGPIGAALLAATMIASAAVLADTLAKYSRGQAGLGDVLWQTVGFIPGGRVAAGAARLARSAKGLAVAGKTFSAALRTVGPAGQRAFRLRTAVPHALGVAGGSLRSAMGNPRLFARAAKCRFVGRDPIDMATGEMILQQLPDFDFPGILPLALQRTYRSEYRAGRWFGPSWSSDLDQRLEIDPSGVCFAGTDGLVVHFPLPEDGQRVLPDEGPRLELVRDGSSYTLYDPESRRTMHFASRPEADGDVGLPLSGVSEPNGQRIDLWYNYAGILSEIHHDGGYRIQAASEGGLITEFRLQVAVGQPDVTLIRYRYDEQRNLVAVLDSSDRTQRFDYDPTGRMIRWCDRNGTEYHYTYDENGRCIATSGSDGCLDGSISYDTGNRITTETNSLGHDTRYYFNDKMQIHRVVDPLGHATVHAWDRYDRKLAEIDPLGRTTSYTYDGAGNLTTVTRPDGNRTAISYNRLRLPLTVTDPDGAVWRREYDDRGNLTSVTDPLGASTTYACDSRGYLVSITDALGHQTAIETNAAGLPVQVTNPLGAATRYVRDAFGRVISIVDPLRHETQLHYTVEGRLSEQVFPDGVSERWSYDGEGNLLEHVDPMGHATRTEIGPIDLPVARTTPDGARTTFTYDTELRLTEVTNPQGLTWRYDYDPEGNVIQETDFNNCTLRYAYDAAGQRIERINGAGEIVRYTFDALGNVLAQHSQERLSTFEYDRSSRLTRAVNPDADVTFIRDPCGRVVAETCNGHTVTSNYDALGRRVLRQTPSGTESLWDYDANSQPVALHTAGHTIAFAYDAAGREVQRHLGGGVLEHAWNSRNQLTDQTLAAVHPETAREARVSQRRSFQYQPNGFVNRIEDSSSGERRFELDVANRVTAVRGATWNETYKYDDTGNITQAAWHGGARTESNIDAQGDRELSGTLVRRAGKFRYEYDGAGRRTLQQQRRISRKPLNWTYRWDADDRLTEVITPDGDRWTYRYDALRRRVAKERHNPKRDIVDETRFVWDGLVLAEQASRTSSDPPERTLPSTITTWDWAPDGLRPLTQASETSRGDGDSQSAIDQEFFAIVTDLIGTPTELVDSRGDVAWRPEYPTIWDPAPSDQSHMRSTCLLRFAGQYHDPETDLAYNYNRYYDPATGGYLSSDPIGLAAGPNPHSYVSNPTVLIDPMGLMAYVSAANGASRLAETSAAAFRAAENPSSIFIKNKHLASSGIRGGKFASDDIAEVQGWVAQGLRSDGVQFLPNQLDDTFRAIVPAGRVVGTGGQTNIRVIVTNDGRVINAFPSQREVMTMEMTYDRLNTDELRGTTLSDYLISLDAHFRVVAGDATLYDEPGFPVVELARSLQGWLSDHDRGDFAFDSMSYEEVGSIFIRQVASGWEVGSIFAQDVVATAVAWDDVEECCRGFVATVVADLSKLGIDPDEVIRR